MCVCVFSRLLLAPFVMSFASDVLIFFVSFGYLLSSDMSANLQAYSAWWWVHLSLFAADGVVLNDWEFTVVNFFLVFRLKFLEGIDVLVVANVGRDADNIGIFRLI